MASYYFPTTFPLFFQASCSLDFDTTYASQVSSPLLRATRIFHLSWPWHLLERCLSLSLGMPDIFPLLEPGLPLWQEHTEVTSHLFKAGEVRAQLAMYLYWSRKLQIVSVAGFLRSPILPRDWQGSCGKLLRDPANTPISHPISLCLITSQCISSSAHRVGGSCVFMWTLIASIPSLFVLRCMYLDRHMYMYMWM